MIGRVRVSTIPGRMRARRRAELTLLRKLDRLLLSALAPCLMAGAAGIAMSGVARAQDASFDPTFDVTRERAVVRSDPDSREENAAESTDAGETEARDPTTITTAPDTTPEPVSTAREIQPLDEPEPEIGPYEPLGLRLGSFLLFPEFTVASLFTDNVFSSSTIRRSDRATVVTPGARLRSNWSRHEIDAGVELSRSYFEEFRSENDHSLDADLRARLDIRRRTSIEAELSYSESLESRGDIDVPDAAAERPEEVSRSAALALNHRINHVSMKLRGEVTQEEFGDVALIGGGTLSSSERDNTARELRLRTAYNFQPEVAIFVEGAGNEVDFSVRLPGEPSRDSTGFEVLGGLSFEVGGKISGEIAAGYAKQFADDPTLVGIERPIINAALEWRPTVLTTLRFDAQTELDPTSFTNSIGSRTQTLDFSVEHVLRRNIILGAGVSYQVEDYAGTDFEQTDVTTTLEAEYLLNRSLGVVAEYEHTESSSTLPADDYTENRLQVGLRVRR